MPGRDRLWTKAWRFLIVGGLNTALTYGIYLLLEPALGGWPAYCSAYACGVLFAFFANGRWVFAARAPGRHVLPYACMHCALAAVGATCTHIFQKFLALNGPAAGLCAIAAVVPLSFLANHLFFSRSAAGLGPVARAATDAPGP